MEFVQEYKTKKWFFSNSGSGSSSIMSISSTGKPPYLHSGIIEAFNADSKDNLHHGYLNSCLRFLNASVLLLKQGLCKIT